MATVISGSTGVSAIMPQASFGVVGSCRNLRAYNNTTGSSTLRFFSDELVLETQFGGNQIRVANYDSTIDLTKIGAGGMDAFGPPSSGFVAIYAIYSQSTGAVSILGANATNSIAKDTYTGASMPAGYTHSALISVWKTSAGAKFNEGAQVDRLVSFPQYSVLTTSTVINNLTLLSIAEAAPLNAKTVTGNGFANSTSSAAVGSGFAVASTASGIGLQQYGTNNSGSQISFCELSLITPQTIYYKVFISTPTLEGGLYITSYRI